MQFKFKNMNNYVRNIVEPIIQSVMIYVRDETRAIWKSLNDFKAWVQTKFAEVDKKFEEFKAWCEDRIKVLEDLVNKTRTELTSSMQTTKTEVYARLDTTIKNLPGLGSPTTTKVNVINGGVMPATTIVYFQCGIGWFDIYISGNQVAFGRDTSYDGYDQRQSPVIVPKGATLSWSGACYPLAAFRMTA